MKLSVDYREGADIFKGLAACGATTDRATLELYDISTEKVGVEIKRMRDFIDSICDGRLDKQCTRMMDSDKLSVVLIIGTVAEVEERYGLRIKRPSIYGAVGSIMVRYGVSVLWVNQPIKYGAIKEAMYIIHKYCKGVEEGKVGRPRLPSRKIKGNVPAGIRAIMKTFGLSKKVAMALHKKFGSLRGVTAAGKAQLQRVDGIGKNRSDLIYSLSRA